MKLCVFLFDFRFCSKCAYIICVVAEHSGAVDADDPGAQERSANGYLCHILGREVLVLDVLAQPSESIVRHSTSVIVDHRFDECVIDDELEKVLIVGFFGKQEAHGFGHVLHSIRRRLVRFHLHQVAFVHIEQVATDLFACTRLIGQLGLFFFSVQCSFLTQKCVLFELVQKAVI